MSRQNVQRETSPLFIMRTFPYVSLGYFAISLLFIHLYKFTNACRWSGFEHKLLLLWLNKTKFHLEKYLTYSCSSLGIIVAQLRPPPESPHTSQHYRIEGLKGSPSLGLHYAETESQCEIFQSGQNLSRKMKYLIFFSRWNI